MLFIDRGILNFESRHGIMARGWHMSLFSDPCRLFKNCFSHCFSDLVFVGMTVMHCWWLPFLPVPLLRIELGAQFALIQPNLIVEERVLALSWKLSWFPVGNIFVRLVVKSMFWDCITLNAVIFFHNIHCRVGLMYSFWFSFTDTYRSTCGLWPLHIDADIDAMNAPIGYAFV